jgi:hypothetical protein
MEAPESDRDYAIRLLDGIIAVEERRSRDEIRIRVVYGRLSLLLAVIDVAGFFVAVGLVRPGVGPAVWLGLVTLALSAVLGNYRRPRVWAVHLGVLTLAGSAFLGGIIPTISLYQGAVRPVYAALVFLLVAGAGRLRLLDVLTAADRPRSLRQLRARGRHVAT